MRVRALETLVTGEPLDPVQVAPGCEVDLPDHIGSELVAAGKAVAVGAANVVDEPAATITTQAPAPAGKAKPGKRAKG
jgi:hypothetical protein